MSRSVIAARSGLFKTLHSWSKEYMLDNVKYLKETHGILPDTLRFWVFRYKSGQDWAYLITREGFSWQDATEGHIHLAIRDGWVPEQVTLEYFQ